ncbi:MAG: SPASM domain-containing protein [Beijerinckiaceae bacterium]
MSDEIKDCRWPWNRLYIHANGDIKPCCYATAPVGNILNGDDPDKIWHGEQMNELRDYIKDNRIHRVCAGSGCSFIRSQMPKGEDFNKQVKYKMLPAGFVPENTLVLAKLGQPEALYTFGTTILHQSLKGKSEKPGIVKHGRNILSGLFALHKASKGGQAGAAYSLAIGAYNNTNPLAEPAAKLAARYYAHRSAELGFPLANMLLGMMYLNGRGVRRDGKRAEAEFKKAAESGESMGYLMAGKVISSYSDYTDRRDEAYQMFKLAERRGLTEATELLAKMNYTPRPIAK